MQNREQMKRNQESHEHSIDLMCGSQPAETNSFGKAPHGQEATPSTQEAKHLAKLKSSDFEFYNRQRWDKLGEVYDKNLEVTYSDGRVSKGLDASVEDLRGRNDFAPDAHIGSHLISFASGEWTAPMRTSRGTFTRPLANAQGRTQLSPNGKKFQSVEAVVSHWQDGVIDRQFHFWDTGTKQENSVLREEINQASMFEEIVGSSEPLRKVLAQVTKVAPSDSTVLLLGETGTGKELIARAIHQRSKRAGRPFVGLNCGAIPASLIASELFGHEKGAFTGATQRRLGRFEAASGGTIFLDEVGDLPPDIQIALLRVLQEREIERVGNGKPIPVDVRVMAATHRDLEKLVREGKFRQDLFYRLNVVPLAMPSLRERAPDIPVLVEYFIARFGWKVGKKFESIDKQTMGLLQAYAWPGNIRELQNVIERAVILSDSNIFAVDEAWLKREPSEVPHSSAAALTGALEAHEKEAIESALAQSYGRVSGPSGAAARLGVPDSTLEAKIKRLGINKYRFKAFSPSNAKSRQIETCNRANS